MIPRLAILLYPSSHLRYYFLSSCIYLVSNLLYPSSHLSVLRRKPGYRYLLDTLASLVSTFDRRRRPR